MKIKELIKNLQTAAGEYWNVNGHEAEVFAIDLKRGAFLCKETKAEAGFIAAKPPFKQINFNSKEET